MLAAMLATLAGLLLSRLLSTTLLLLAGLLAAASLLAGPRIVLLLLLVGVLVGVIRHPVLLKVEFRPIATKANA